MTKGNPFPIMLSFALPLFLGNVFQQLYNIIDSVVVGRAIGANALAAVGATVPLNFLILGFAMGLCSGLCIPVAQRFGAGDIPAMRAYIANAAYLASVIGVIITVIAVLFTRPTLELLNTPPEIIDDAYDFIVVIFAGIPSIMFYNLLAGILRALGDSKTPLYFLVVACIINAVADIVMIVGLGMGVGAAGIATVGAQTLSGFLCLFYMRKNFPVLTFSKDELKPSLARMKTLASVGLPMALQFSIIAIGSLILQWSVNGLGTIKVTAVTTANRITQLTFMPLDTLGITMATYCGQNLGAGKLDRIRKGVGIGIKTGLVYSVVAGVALAFLGQYMGMLFVSPKETAVLNDLVYFLRIVSVAYPTLAVLLVIRNSLQGMGFPLVPLGAGLLEMAARMFAALALVKLWGFFAVCISAPMAWVGGDILLIPAYFVAIAKLKKRFALPSTVVAQKAAES
ncbi:MAG: MATE family efflux transporter [Oscillospiraceae bacterium]|nr:MATE family efflux transporter [Oscillospiraceae bacterium]